MPRQIPYPVTVSYGAPMAPDAKPHEVRKEVVALGAEAWEQRKEAHADDRAGLCPNRAAGAGALRFRRHGRGEDELHGGADEVVLFGETAARTVGRAAKRGHSPSAVRRRGADQFGRTADGKDGGELELHACPRRDPFLHRAVRDPSASSPRRRFIEKFDFDLGVPMLTLEEIAAKPRVTEKLAAARAWRGFVRGAG